MYNLDSYICLRGFSRVVYSHLVMIILGLEKPNVRLEKTGIKTNKTKKKVNSMNISDWKRKNSGRFFIEKKRRNF